MQHGDALGRWATLADPSWDYKAAFARFRAGYRIPLEAEASMRGSRTGELIARCMVETGTSSYYTALGEATAEPVLKQICRLIAADEFRHFKLFYDHMRRWLAREHIGLPRRLRIAAGRIGETEDDELAFAWHCANEPAGVPYDRAPLHGRLYGPRHGVLSPPPHPARHGHDLQDGRPAAAGPAVRRLGAALLASPALPPAPLCPPRRRVTFRGQW